MPCAPSTPHKALSLSTVAVFVVRAVRSDSIGRGVDAGASYVSIGMDAGVECACQRPVSLTGPG